MDKKFPTQQVLELACAAQRINGSYIKMEETVHDEDDDYKFLYMRHSNKMLMPVSYTHLTLPTKRIV